MDPSGDGPRRGGPAWISLAILLAILGPLSGAPRGAGAEADGSPVPAASSGAGTASPGEASPARDLLRLTALNDSLWRSGRRDSAMSVLGRGVGLARDLGDTLALVDLLTRAGQQLRFFGRAAEGESSLREAIALASGRRDTMRVIAATRWLSVVVGMQGRPEEAHDLAQTLYDLAEARRDRRHQGWARVGLAWHAHRQGRTDEAIRLYREAAPHFEAVQEAEGTLWSLLGLGFTSTTKGDYATAADAYRRTIALARERGDPISEGSALNDLGKIEYYLGDPGGARELFRRAAELHRSVGSWHEVVLPTINLALCESDLGREAAAEETLRACLALCRGKGFGAHEIAVRIELAGLSSRRGRIHEAAGRYQEILEEERLTLRQRIETLEGHAQVMAAAGSPETALGSLAEARALLRDHPESEYLPIILLGLGQLQAVTGRSDAAIETLLLAAESAARAGQHQTRIRSLLAAIPLWHARGNSAQARAAVLQAAEIWERERGRALDPEWREQHREIGPALYAALLDELLGTPPAPSEVADGGHVCAAPGTAIAAAFDRVQAFKSRTLLERMLGPGETLEELLRAEASARAGLARLQVDVLRPGEIFLDLYASPRSTTLFAVTRDTALAVRLPGERVLGDPILFFHQLCGSPPSRHPRPDELATLEAEGLALRRTILGAIEPLLASAHTAYVAPDGIFHLLPLAALASGRSETAGRLAPPGGGSEGRKDATRWIRVPSASMLAEQRQRIRSTPTGPPRILAAAGTTAGAGTRLRGTTWEVGEIGRRYRHVRVLADGTNTSELRAELGRCDLLHLACHLRLDPQSPWQSELQFDSAGSSANLRAGQIAGMRLPARLAILSSCASADGRILSGEGVPGVTSAFLAAGVPVVLATLWPVDDRATARFMTQVYNQLAGGESVSAAVDRAQEATRRTPATAHPFYWAGFVVVGDGSMTIRPERRHPLARHLPLAPAAGLLAAFLVTAALAPRRSTRRP